MLLASPTLAVELVAEPEEEVAEPVPLEAPVALAAPFALLAPGATVAELLPLAVPETCALTEVTAVAAKATVARPTRTNLCNRILIPCDFKLDMGSNEPASLRLFGVTACEKSVYLSLMEIDRLW